MEINFIKADGCAVPVSDEDRQKFYKLKYQVPFKAKISYPRNYNFHKKFFVMMSIGFHAFEPPEKYYEGRLIQKSFDRFRKDVIIAAGYYDIVIDMKDRLRYEPKSISFSNMSQEEFERVYNDCCNVLLKEVLGRYSFEELQEEVNRNLVDKLIYF